MQKSVIVAAMWGIFGTALPTFADPVRVTSGSLIGSDSDVTDFVLSGPGFFLNGIIGEDPPGTPNFRCGPLECLPGSELSLSSSYTDGADVITGTVNGADYTGIAAHFDFIAPTITIPDLPNDEITLIKRPFSFTGRANGANGSGNAFALTLTGSGTVVLELIRTAEDGVNAIGTRYNFTATDPVPEPAMLLLTSGLAGVAATRCRRTPASAG
jgi:hypothetical protein